jgi:hypothetical protein
MDILWEPGASDDIRTSRGRISSIAPPRRQTSPRPPTSHHKRLMMQDRPGNLGELQKL